MPTKGQILTNRATLFSFNSSERRSVEVVFKCRHQTRGTDPKLRASLWVRPRQTWNTQFKTNTEDTLRLMSANDWSQAMPRRKTLLRSSIQKARRCWFYDWQLEGKSIHTNHPMDAIFEVYTGAEHGLASHADDQADRLKFWCRFSEPKKIIVSLPLPFKCSRFEPRIASFG